MRKNNNIIGVVDLGSAKTVCFIAEVSAGEVMIKGIGHTQTRGVRSGLIVDMQQAKQSIAKAIELANKMAGTKVKKVTCAISSCVLLAKNMNAKVSISGKEINHNDITKLKLSLNDMIDSNDYEILHKFIYDYKLDGYSGITNPVGMYGRELSCSSNIILCHKNILLNYQQCFSQLGIEIRGFVAAPYAASYSLLSDEDQDYGAILIDFGYSTSSISYIKNGQMRFLDSVPLGSLNLVNDLMQGIGVSFSTADRIKSLYGTLNPQALNDNEVIDIDDDSDIVSEGQPITKDFVNEIIQARTEEIVELLQKKLISSGIRVDNARVILSGGMSIMRGMQDLLGRYGLKGKIEIPQYINGIADSVTGPAFSTSVGLLQYAVSNHRKRFGARGALNITGMLHWLKENF